MAGFSSPLSPDSIPAAGYVMHGCWRVTNPYAGYYQIKPGVWNYHTGLDTACAGGATLGSPLYAVGDGVITFARRVPNSTWGYVIVLESDNPDGGLVHFRYGHCHTMAVKTGDKVLRGQIIGSVGDAFGQFAAHLHIDCSISGILKTTPHHWPGANKSEVLKHYIDPGKWIREHAYIPHPTEYERFTAALKTLPSSSPVIVAMDGKDYELTVADFRKPTTYTVTASLLNVRREPSTNAAIVDTLRHNSAVTILETRDGWGRTDRGWVSMAWLRAA
jgi:hypothetical protein